MKHGKYIKERQQQEKGIFKNLFQEQKNISKTRNIV